MSFEHDISDGQLSKNLEFISNIGKAVTMVLNTEASRQLSSSDLQNLQKLQLQVKEFNMERPLHEFSQAERKDLLRFISSFSHAFLKLSV